MMASSVAEFSRKHVSLRHGEARSFTGKERNTGRGVANQGSPAVCPMIHSNLADTVKIDVARILHRSENLRAFPADIGKGISQQRFASLLVPVKS